MGKTFTAPIYRFMQWLERRAMVCENCRGPVPEGRRHYCSDECYQDFQDALAI